MGMTADRNSSQDSDRPVSGKSGSGARLPTQLSRMFARYGLWAGLAIGFVLAVSAALFTGFEAGRRKLEPLYTVFSKIDAAIERQSALSPPHLTDREYPSGLITISAKIGVIDAKRSVANGPISENGGGLAAFGDEILVLPYSGDLYAAKGADSVRKTRIRAPDNGRAAFLALKDDRDVMSKFQFDFGYLRYNDLAYYEAPGERGLLASYVEFHADRRCVTNTLAKLPFADGVTSIADIEEGAQAWRVIYRTAPCLEFKTDGLAMEGHMSGGRLAFQPPSTVYMTSGDFHFDGMRSEGSPVAQDPTAAYGKTLKIDVLSGVGSIVSSGHRNPQGITIGSDGAVYTTDQGPRGGDELNRLTEGANYGWPRESLGIMYRGTAIPGSVSFGRHDTLEAPVYAWMPSPAISALKWINGFDPAWDGDFLAGSLVDLSIYRVRTIDGRAVYSERIQIGSRIRDIDQMNDGRIVLWTDNGELVFLTATPLADQLPELERFFADENFSPSAQASIRNTIERCAECHSFADAHEKSPGLGRAFNAQIASTPFPNYSEALRRAGGRWTRDRLKAFLSNPSHFAQGTTMPDPGIKDDATLDAVVEYLSILRRRI